MSILQGFVYYFSKTVPNFCEADLTSFDDSVYTCPVLVQGSTIVKMSCNVVATLLCAQAVGMLMALEDAVMLTWLDFHLGLGKHTS